MEQEFAEGIDSWETMMFLYNSALKEVNTKLEIQMTSLFTYIITIR